MERVVVAADLIDDSTIERTYARPTSRIEMGLAELLAGVVQVSDVSAESNFFDDLSADSLVMAQFCARVRKRPDLPSVSMKDIYLHPTIRGLATAFAEPLLTPIETTLAEVLADVVHVDRVSVESHFFDDLGADSLVMAQFCARVRKRPDLPSVSMKDIYRYPTIKSLATAFADPVAGLSAEPLHTVHLPTLTSTGSAAPVAMPAPLPASTRRYVVCGALQLLLFLLYTYLTAVVATRGYEWISAGSGVVDLYLRAVLFSGGLFFVLSTLPIVAKWLLIGRWKPQEIPIWTLAYLRFFVVKTLIRANPLVLLIAGSPLYTFYLRALGAKVGRGVVIFTRSVPVCTDLLTIGDGTVIRKDTLLNCYRAHAGVIQTGSVTLGSNVFVGEVTILDIETSVGDDAQLGHSSSLHAGQAVPAGERWHGSPAQRTDVNYQTVEPTDCGTLRRMGYALLQVLTLLFVYLPVGIAVIGVLLMFFPGLNTMLGTGLLGVTSQTLLVDALAGSFVLVFGTLLIGLLIVLIVPRLLYLFLRPDKVYGLYGFCYSIERTIARMTNGKFFLYLFGDSSYIVKYLQGIGYKLSPVVQTGTNFGTSVKHEVPYLSQVGSGTMVADGLSFMNADFSNTSFRVSQVSVGAHSFLGNHIAYPPQAKIGDNCLLATKVLVPLDGKIRENVGLLGSPSFEIPRSVERDRSFEDVHGATEFRRRLTLKNKYNLRTMALALLVRWMYVFGVTSLALATAPYYARFGSIAVFVDVLLTLLFSLAFFVLLERAVSGLRPLRPRFCSVYDPHFWWHERYWKFVLPPSLDQRFVGTPFKNIVSRLLGVRVGKRVFNDGFAMTEKTLVTIGDDCTLNVKTTVQCHSQEDGSFKSDRTSIGAGCTLGVGAFVHYGVTVGDGAIIAADSFVMKGEEVPEHAHWGGNPAGEMRATDPDLRVPQFGNAKYVASRAMLTAPRGSDT